MWNTTQGRIVLSLLACAIVAGVLVVMVTGVLDPQPKQAEGPSVPTGDFVTDATFAQPTSQTGTVLPSSGELHNINLPDEVTGDYEVTGIRFICSDASTDQRYTLRVTTETATTSVVWNTRQACDEPSQEPSPPIQVRAGSQLTGIAGAQVQGAYISVQHTPPANAVNAQGNSGGPPPTSRRYIATAEISGRTLTFTSANGTSVTYDPVSPETIVGVEYLTPTLVLTTVTGKTVGINIEPGSNAPNAVTNAAVSGTTDKTLTLTYADGTTQSFNTSSDRVFDRVANFVLADQRLRQSLLWDDGTTVNIDMPTIYTNGAVRLPLARVEVAGSSNGAPFLCFAGGGAGSNDCLSAYIHTFSPTQASREALARVTLYDPVGAIRPELNGLRTDITTLQGQSLNPIVTGTVSTDLQGYQVLTLTSADGTSSRFRIIPETATTPTATLPPRLQILDGLIRAAGYYIEAIYNFSDGRTTPALNGVLNSSHLPRNFADDSERLIVDADLSRRPLLTVDNPATNGVTSLFVYPRLNC
jgi:hypothetical protein